MRQQITGLPLMPLWLKGSSGLLLRNEVDDA
jgi:hypothetical protein